jgi:hypothetical protein
VHHVLDHVVEPIHLEDLVIRLPVEAAEADPNQYLAAERLGEGNDPIRLVRRHGDGVRGQADGLRGSRLQVCKALEEQRIGEGIADDRRQIEGLYSRSRDLVDVALEIAELHHARGSLHEAVGTEPAGSIADVRSLDVDLVDHALLDDLRDLPVRPGAVDRMVHRHDQASIESVEREKCPEEPVGESVEDTRPHRRGSPSPAGGAAKDGLSGLALPTPGLPRYRTHCSVVLTARKK